MKSLALNILDIVQNSIRAEASKIDISVAESDNMDSYTITITDNGAGMDEDLLIKAADPFFTTRTTRKIGLGLPLIKQQSEMTGGKFTINSKNGQGTCLKVSFSKSHPDRQPSGDIPGVLRILISSNPGIEFTLTYSTDIGCYFFSTEETKKILEVEQITDRELLNDITGMIKENLLIINVSEIEYKG